MRNPHRRRGRVATTVLIGVVVILYAPLLFLVVASVNSNPSSTQWQGFTTTWYRDAYNDAALRQAVGVSIRLAIIASVVSVAVGTIGAVAARKSRWLRGVNTVLATVRIGTPVIIIATGIASILPVLDIAFGFRPMAIAHIAYLSAYVMLIVGARAAGADPLLEDAALDLGAGPWRVLRRIVLPDLKPAIISSALLTLAFSFDDVALSLALRGPTDTTVPIYVFSAVRRRVTPSIHAIGVAIMIVGVTMFLAANLVNSALASNDDRRRRRNQTKVQGRQSVPIRP